MANDDEYASRPDEEYTEERRKPNASLMLSLGRLEQGMKNVLSQLSEMNGTQKELLERMNAVELFDQVHPLQCPMKSQILQLKEQFEKHVLVADTEKKTDRKWWEKLTPVIYTVAGLLLCAVLVVLLTHINSWSHLITGR